MGIKQPVETTASKTKHKSILENISKSITIKYTTYNMLIL